MQGKKIYTEKLFSSFQLSDRVPKNNFYRQLKEQLDLKFIPKITAKYYGTEGQQSIDPEVFFKLLLVGYLENLNSDRKIIEHAKMRLDILYFIGYDIDEELPWHSTLSRTRQLYGQEVFLELFRQVLKLCIDKGMVSGRRQAMDSAYIKANASLSSLIEKEVMDDAQTYSEELASNEENSLKKKTISYLRKKKVEQHHAWKAKQYEGQHKFSKELCEGDAESRPKFLSNHTHYSTTDPDAMISVKPGKPRQLNYTAQVAVDTSHHVITGMLGDYSDKRDSQSLEQLTEQTKANLRENELYIEELLADSGYSSGSALEYLEQQQLTGYIPNFGKYKPEREGFIYNKEKDQYECTQGNKAVLPYKSTSTDTLGFEKKSYRSSSKVCKNCPLRKTCIGEKATYKKIDDSIYKPQYDRMHKRMQSNYAKRMMTLRSSTVEPVLGTLINFTGMRRIWTRGIKSANKFIICAGIAYNLKKYIKFISRKIKTLALSVPVPPEKAGILTENGSKHAILLLTQSIRRYTIEYFFRQYRFPWCN
jgi:transposase